MEEKIGTDYKELERKLTAAIERQAGICLTGDRKAVQSATKAIGSLTRALEVVRKVNADPHRRSLPDGTGLGAALGFYDAN